MKKKKLMVSLLTMLMFCMMFSITVCAEGKWKTTANGKTYYYEEDGSMHKGWLNLSGKRYFFSRKTGAMATGLHTIAGVVYDFGKDGVLVGTYKKAGFKKTASGKIYYSYGNSLPRPKNCWLTIDNKTYSFGKSGYVRTGWKTIKGSTYFFNEKGVMQTGKWRTYKGHQVYLGADGKMAKNTWIGKRYVNSSGYYVKGYVDQRRTSKSKTGWVGYDKTWKYYKKNKLVTGWQTINKKRYYFNSKGVMQTGWIKDGNFRYFLDTRAVSKVGKKPGNLGQALQGWAIIGKKYYYFFKTEQKDSKGVTWPKYSMARDISLRFTTTKGEIVYNFDKNGVSDRT